MGMYTEFMFRADLEPNTPDEVIDVLQFMINREKDTPEPPLPDHEFFRSTRWRDLAKMWNPLPGSEISLRGNGGYWRVFISSSIKNYDNEVEKFIDWIKPFVDDYGSKQFIGYSLYEENREPTLYYTDGDQEDLDTW